MKVFYAIGRFFRSLWRGLFGWRSHSGKIHTDKHPESPGAVETEKKFRFYNRKQRRQGLKSKTGSRVYVKRKKELDRQLTQNQRKQAFLQAKKERLEKQLQKEVASGRTKTETGAEHSRTPANPTG